jgi:hypothetical protein
MQYTYFREKSSYNYEKFIFIIQHQYFKKADNIEKYFLNLYPYFCCKSSFFQVENYIFAWLKTNLK